MALNDKVQVYNLLNEQDNENQLNISQKVLFPPGYYNQSYIVDTLNPIIERVRTFLSTNREIPYTIDIVISASESRIPNTDKEQGGTIVDPGYLSGKRQEMKGNAKYNEIHANSCNARQWT